MRKIFFSILSIIIILSCNKNTSTDTLEIEPNNNFEYSQFIDHNTIINGSFNATNDIDYYKIHPTNGFIMDFDLNAKNNIVLKIIDNTKTNVIFNINTENILNYNGEIKIENFIFYNDEYYLVLESLVEGQYKIKFSFNSTMDYKKEIEDNNSFNSANIIDYPNQKVYGYFFENKNVDDIIKHYLLQTNLIDIDIYKVKNSTDIKSSISINTHYSDNIEILLFDTNKTFIKKSENKLKVNFPPKKEYFIVLAYYNNKYLLGNYTLYYTFD